MYIHIHTRIYGSKCPRHIAAHCNTHHSAHCNMQHGTHNNSAHSARINALNVINLKVISEILDAPRVGRDERRSAVLQQLQRVGAQI